MNSAVTKQTRVELALVAAIVATIVGGVMWLQTRLADLQTTCRSISFEQTRMRDKLDSMNRELWTQQQMENWALRLKLANDSLTVPTPTGTGEVR